MLRQMANIKWTHLLCVYALIVRLMLQRNNEIEAHDGRQSNKASFLTGFMIAAKIRLSIILRNHGYKYSTLYHLYARQIRTVHTYALIGRRHFWRKVLAGLL